MMESGPPPKYSLEHGTHLETSYNPNQTVKLYNNSQQRRLYEDMADLYTIIKSTEHLEKAYIKDAISSDEYTEACQRLISQFKTTEKALGLNTLDFMNEYKMDCPLAVERLLTAGVPATVMHAHSGARSKLSWLILFKILPHGLIC